MNHLLFSNPFKKGMRAAVALAILLFSLAPGGTRIAHAAPPINDDFNSAKVITTLTYGDTLVTTEATPTVANPTTDDPNNINCEGDVLAAGYSTVWYRYTPGAAESIALNTAGSNYDTFIAVWTGSRGSLNLVACNDDTFALFTSDLFFIGTPGTTYHIEVAKFNGVPEESCDIKPGGCSLQFNAFISTTNVSIHGTVVGNYSIPTGGSLRTGYPGVDDGPAKITNTNGANGISAMRVIWNEPGLRFSYSEMMGLPTNRLSTEYWFPWYNNTDTVSMDQGFRIANVDTTQHTIRIFLGSNQVGGDIILAGGGSTRVGFGVNSGPIRIQCSTCTGSDRIIAALRVIWQEPGFRSSYSEMMGLPKEQLSSEYWFPWYNNLFPNTVMDQGFRIGNVDTAAGNTVEVWIGGALMETINLGPGGSVRVGYNVDNGPARVVCTTCTNMGNDKIITALRVIWREPGLRTSYSEMMGLPTEQLSNEYWLPWYNNLSTTSMDQGFRIANLDDTLHTIKIFVGATQIGTDLNLGAGVSTRVGYPVDSGPIRILCTTCTNPDDKIIAALRVIWQEPGPRTSYSEMMGLPVQHLSSEYWFPWYNNKFPNAVMDQGFRFGMP